MQEKNISEIDENFKQKESVCTDLKYYDVNEKPVVLEGMAFTNEDGRRCRLPKKTAEIMRKHVVCPSLQTAGAIVRFRTDSPRIGIRLKVDEYYVSLSKRSSAGFDLYSGTGSDMRFLGGCCMEKPVTDFEFSWEIEKYKMQDYSICLPTFCSFFKIEIGTAPEANLEVPTPHRYSKPIVFYGSSITNCGAVGRPGLLYPSILGRMLDIETLNIGFSGSCFGETCVADQIAKLDISMLVLEYDHNAKTVEFLQETHEAFFKYLRNLRPDLPVVMMSMPYADFSKECYQQRRAIVARTWLNAFEAGDRNVEFIDGESFFAGTSLLREDCSADCCHQNDLGERLMAERLYDRIKRILDR